LFVHIWRKRPALEKYLNQESDLHYQLGFSPQTKDERYLFMYKPGKVTLESCTLLSGPTDSPPICDSKPVSTGLMMRQPLRDQRV
jgi:hypothetical protein